MTGTRERNRLEVERAGRIVDAEAEVRRCEIDVVSAARVLIDTRPGERPDRVFVHPDALDHLRLVVGDLDRAMSELARLRVTP